MTHRTTFAFDISTIHRLKKISSRWSVSQAEVIRRVLLQAENALPSEALDPVKTLRLLHSSGHGLSKKIGNAYLKEIYEERMHWRAKE